MSSIQYFTTYATLDPSNATAAQVGGGSASTPGTSRTASTTSAATSPGGCRWWKLRRVDTLCERSGCE